jgi:hypothetical protein
MQASTIDHAMTPGKLVQDSYNASAAARATTTPPRLAALWAAPPVKGAEGLGVGVTFKVVGVVGATVGAVPVGATDVQTTDVMVEMGIRLDELLELVGVVDLELEDQEEGEEEEEDAGGLSFLMPN